MAPVEMVPVEVSSGRSWDADPSSVVGSQYVSYTNGNKPCVLFYPCGFHSALNPGDCSMLVYKELSYSLNIDLRFYYKGMAADSKMFIGCRHFVLYNYLLVFSDFFFALWF